MRAANPVKEVRHIGLMGEELAAYLNTLQATEPRQFNAVEKALHTLLPNIDGIDIEISNIGEVELRLKENGVAIPSRVVSEGTLRLLGLLALNGVGSAPSLVGFEEPENGVHPQRIQLIAELLKTRSKFGTAQYIVTSHSPILPDKIPADSLFVVQRQGRYTQIYPYTDWGPLWRRRSIDIALEDPALEDPEEEHLPVSKRILRGDFDA